MYQRGICSRDVYEGIIIIKCTREPIRGVMESSHKLADGPWDSVWLPQKARIDSVASCDKIKEIS